MYSILIINGERKIATKGVGRVVAKKMLNHELFKQCLMEGEEVSHEMVKIGHKNHQLQTQTMMKKSLSPFNDKKWIHKHGQEFKTYSFGNKNIEGEICFRFYK